jgi:hypothetical protein
MASDSAQETRFAIAQRERDVPAFHPEPEEVLDAYTIAELTDRAIEAMTRDELIRLIHAGRYPRLQADADQHTPYADRATLLRVAFLVRRCCRNRIAR